jgi:hypothetical protein
VSSSVTYVYNLLQSRVPAATVVLQPVFVRDHLRRLRRVIDLLEQEARCQHASPTNSDDHHNLRSFRQEVCKKN